MITDDLLERGLGALGDGYDVPPQAQEEILAQLRPAAALPEYDEEPAATHRRWPPTRRTWAMSSAAAVVVLIVVAFAVGGGSGGSPSLHAEKSAGGNVATNGAAPVGAPDYATSGGNGAGSYADGTAGSAVGNAPAAVPLAPTRGQVQTKVQSTAPQTTGTQSVAPDSLTKIVQTGELDLQVDKIKVADAVTALEGYAARAGGMVANSQTVEGDGAPSASVTLRIPNSAFGTVLGQARGLGKVLSQQTKSADVTAQYVDLGARIHALGLTKQTYLGILSRATTIGQTLSVQQYLNDIQTQIEQLQGQLKVLTDQTTYGTLTVSIDQKSHIAPVVVHHQSGISKAVHRSISRFVHGIEAIIGIIGPIVLVLLIVALGWLAAKVGYRIVRRQMV